MKLNALTIVANSDCEADDKEEEEEEEELRAGLEAIEVE